MDKCFVPCGCDDRYGVTKSDLDSFTDNVENVLNNEKGRRLFRNFMRSCKMKDGRRKLDLLEHIDKIFKKSVENEENALDSLLDEAQLIEELDFALMSKLATARRSDNKDDMIEALKLLKIETIATLTVEYDAFRRRYGRSKSQ